MMKVQMITKRGVRDGDVYMVVMMMMRVQMTVMMM